MKTRSSQRVNCVFKISVDHAQLLMNYDILPAHLLTQGQAILASMLNRCMQDPYTQQVGPILHSGNLDEFLRILVVLFSS